MRKSVTPGLNNSRILPFDQDMSTQEHTAASEKRGMLHWMGIGRGRGANIARLSVLAEQLRAISPGSRAQVIASMAEFFDQHDLPVCQDVLAVAHDYVTDGDRTLIKLIDEQTRMGQPVTVEWLRKLRGNDRGANETHELQRTYEQLEKQLIDFGTMAGVARRATQDYGISLEGHAEQLGSQSDLNTSVAEILGIVRSMIHRTSDIEREMAMSERQSKELRKNLDEALRSAEEDELTGVPNRRAFEKTYEHEYNEARAAAEPLVVAFCDIDHFKNINDTHGHDTGDRVLKAVARTLFRISSERCYVARHGGEEFAVLFRGKSLEEATDILDNARMGLSERRFVDRHSGTPIGFVTFSAGVANVFAYPDRSAALKAADTALYWAKDHGRNQIAIAE